MSYLIEDDILDLIGFEPIFHLSGTTLTVDLSPKTQLIGMLDVEATDPNGYDDFEDAVADEFFSSNDWVKFLYEHQGLDISNLNNLGFDDALKPITGEDTVYELEMLLRSRLKDAFISWLENAAE